MAMYMKFQSEDYINNNIPDVMREVHDYVFGTRYTTTLRDIWGSVFKWLPEEDIDFNHLPVYQAFIIDTVWDDCKDASESGILDSSHPSTANANSGLQEAL